MVAKDFQKSLEEVRAWPYRDFNLCLQFRNAQMDADKERMAQQAFRDKLMAGMR